MKLTLEQLAKLEPVCALSRQRLAELATLCRCEHLAIGANPVSGLSAGVQFMYLVAGELRIVLQDGSQRILVGGCDDANWPIGYKAVLPVSSKAITECDVLTIDYDLIDIMMTWDQLSSAVDQPEPSKNDAATSWATMSGAFSAQALTSGGLSQLPPAHIHELLQRFERIKTKRGQIVIEEGTAGDYYYLIESGRCQVSKMIGGVQVELAELKAGDAFGEEALVSDSRRTASVKMKTDGVLLRLSKPDFIELLKEPLVHSITWDEAERQVEVGDAFWLDVRYPAEFSADGLPGAINVPLSEVRSAFGVLDKGKSYMVYCHTGRRSSAATFLLAQQGFSVRCPEGGLAAMVKK
jgi:rhodanese-related sulfurtransferase